DLLPVSGDPDVTRPPGDPMAIDPDMAAAVPFPEACDPDMVGSPARHHDLLTGYRGRNLDDDPSGSTCRTTDPDQEQNCNQESPHVILLEGIKHARAAIRFGQRSKRLEVFDQLALLGLGQRGAEPVTSVTQARQRRIDDAPARLRREVGPGGPVQHLDPEAE